MSKPATRMLAVLELLQTHGQMSGVELAQRLGVGSRTLRRYIAGLEDLGIPITSELGRHGGYSLVAGFKLPPMMFTNAEALAISLGLLAADGLGLRETGTAVATAQAKLERVLPAPLKERMRALGATATLDAASGPATGNPEVLMALALAAQSNRRVRFDYRARNGDASARECEPYGLVFRSGAWYVSGMCRLRGEMRSFRLDRMGKVTETGEAFERPADFDIAAYFALSMATLPRAHAVEVMLFTALENAALRLGPNIGVLEPRPDGVLLRTSTDSFTWFARELAHLPFGFDVRHPPELLAAVHAHARRMLGETAGKTAYQAIRPGARRVEVRNG